MPSRTVLRPVYVLGGVGALIAITLVVLLARPPAHRVRLAPAATEVSSSTQSPPNAGSGNSAQSSTPPAVRWWVSPAGPIGATIDVENPEASAARLTPSHTDYCALLRSSMNNSNSPFAAQAGLHSNAVATAHAWLAEIEALSDGQVRTSWQTFGPTLVAAMTSTHAPARPADSVSAAVSMIANDARTSCGLDLSTVR